ncbi:hypothetical protein D7X48_12650 [bacterium D16-50]|nr:hypothetical protein D7X48_12650 [bacterium D16-50]
MKIIRISTDSEMSVHEFPEGTYREQNEELRRLIGPQCELFEHVLPKRLYSELGVPGKVLREAGGFVSMLIDEEGIFNDLDENPIGSYLYETDKHGHPIAGNILLVGEKLSSEGVDFCGISDKRFGLLYTQLKEMIEKERAFA